MCRAGTCYYTNLQSSTHIAAQSISIHKRTVGPIVPADRCGRGRLLTTLLLMSAATISMMVIRAGPGRRAKYGAVAMPSTSLRTWTSSPHVSKTPHTTPAISVGNFKHCSVTAHSRANCVVRPPCQELLAFSSQQSVQGPNSRHAFLLPRLDVHQIHLNQVVLQNWPPALQHVVIKTCTPLSANNQR